MAPEVALEALASLPAGSTVLDPMCGSGTVLREAIRENHQAFGFDIDPLAVLVARVSTRPIDTGHLVEIGSSVAAQAAHLQDREVDLPWLEQDAETRKFIEFWFGERQRRSLQALACLVSLQQGPIKDALRLAISKTIVTKSPCASLARDTSHSRPHKVMETSDYDVIQGFRRAVHRIARELERDPPTGNATVRRCDARSLPEWTAGRADLIITSPPYGNAIDYLRGHRLALVWLGYTLARLRDIRARSIGTPGGHSGTQANRVLQEIASHLGPVAELDISTRQRLYRFTRDMLQVMGQVYLALKPGGRAILVVGNSIVKGVFLQNTRMITEASRQLGFREVSQYSREIPANHRYLPPPGKSRNQALGKRIKEEVVLTFEKTQ